MGLAPLVRDGLCGGFVWGALTYSITLSWILPGPPYAELKGSESTPLAPVLVAALNATGIAPVDANAAKWKSIIKSASQAPVAAFLDGIRTTTRTTTVAFGQNHGKLKAVIDMRMWRNWQTRRI